MLAIEVVPARIVSRRYRIRFFCIFLVRLIFFAVRTVFGTGNGRRLWPLLDCRGFRAGRGVFSVELRFGI